MKNRSTTPVSTSFALKSSLVAVAVLVAVATPIQLSRVAHADSYQDQINALQKQSQSYEDQANKLREEANTLQGVLNQLAAEKQAIQTQISLKQAESKKLQEDIAANKNKVKETQTALSGTLSDLYVDDSISPIEMLASSSNIGDFIDKQEQRTALSNSLTDKISEIKTLRQKLEEQQKDVEKVLAEQKLKESELASKEAAQQKLLAETNSSEQAYRDQMAQNQGQIKQLEAARQALLSRPASQAVGSYVTTGGSGGYPWAGVSYPCWNSYTCADPWALFYRECTSYVAWRLSNQGYGVRSFGGAGHAYQWPSTTSGYTSQRVGANPQRGDAAVLPANVGGAAWTGHVMYVEEVYSDGSIRISEYNWAGNGSYSERKISPSEYRSMTFISFPKR